MLSTVGILRGIVEHRHGLSAGRCMPDRTSPPAWNQTDAMEVCTLTPPTSLKPEVAFDVARKLTGTSEPREDSGRRTRGLRSTLAEGHR
jgi:hypothetical protein